MKVLKETKGLNEIKFTGTLANFVALGVTLYQIADNQYEGRPGEAVADVMMSLVAFVPGWGWGASGVYFVVIKPIIKSGEQLYEMVVFY